MPPMWVGGVVVARVAWWVPWIAGRLVQLAARAVCEDPSNIQGPIATPGVAMILAMSLLVVASG